MKIASEGHYHSKRMRKFYKINLITDVVVLFYVIISYIIYIYGVVYHLGGYWWMDMFISSSFVGVFYAIHSIFILFQLLVKSRRKWKTFWYSFILLITSCIILFIFSTFLIWTALLERCISSL